MNFTNDNVKNITNKIRRLLASNPKIQDFLSSKTDNTSIVHYKAISARASLFKGMSQLTTSKRPRVFRVCIGFEEPPADIMNSLRSDLAEILSKIYDPRDIVDFFRQERYHRYMLHFLRCIAERLHREDRVPTMAALLSALMRSTPQYLTVEALAGALNRFISTETVEADGFQDEICHFKAVCEESAYMPIFLGRTLHELKRTGLLPAWFMELIDSNRPHGFSTCVEEFEKM